MMPYIKIKDVLEKILWRYRHDTWLEHGSYFCINSRTKRDHVCPDLWVSIGIQLKSGYNPLWDVYAPTDLAKEVVTQRLKYACLRIGGRYAEGFKTCDQSTQQLSASTTSTEPSS